MEELEEREDGSRVADENLVNSEVSVSKGEVEESLSEELGREDGICNGEDIMVGVLGSDVYVDGVCSNRNYGNLNDVGEDGNKLSVEGDGKSPVGDDGGVDDDGIANESGQSAVEGISGAGESVGEIPREVVEGAERDVDAMVLDDEGRTDDLSVVAGAVDRETEARHVEEEDVVREAMDVEESEVESDPGSLSHNSVGDKVLNSEESQKIEVQLEQSKNSITDNGVGENLVDVGGESELVTEEASVTDGGEASGKGQVLESVEEGKQPVAGVDTSVDLKSEQLGISDADVRSPGIETSSSSVDGNENSNYQGQDTEKATEMFSENDLNPEDISHSDGSEKLFSNLERGESCIVATEHEETGKDDRRDDQSQVSGGVEDNILINGQKITGIELPGLGAELKSGNVPETAVQPLSGEDLDTTENFASTDSISSIQVDQMNVQADVAANDSAMFTSNTEVSAVSEHNLNAEIEGSNMESYSQANGQVAATMNAEQGKNDVNDTAQADFENVEEMGIEHDNLIEVCLHDEEEMEDVTDLNNGDDQIVECTLLNPESPIKELQARYQLPLENDGDFSVSDLVWGKVRSHPWWPGQIFDPCDSSEKAMRYYKKDFFLVAYFGDRTFAWNEVSHLKPFRTHFSQEEMQSNSEAFQNSVECALEEVSRRSELGLACGCTPREAYDMIKCQIVENAGIREESSRRYGVDKSASASSFEPAKLIEYIRDLARFPSDGSDRLELVIAKAQLTAFYRLKGYCSLPQFQFCGLPQYQFCGGLEDDSGTGMRQSDFVQHAAHQDDAQTLSHQGNLKGQSSYHKRKHNLKDGLYPTKKERSLSELMGETYDSLDGENWSDGKTTLASPSAKKRKTVDYPTDDSSTPDGRKTIPSPKVSNTAPLKQSFKIGDCIRRVASQLTGTPPIVKSNSDKFQKPDGGFDGHPGYESDVLLQNFDDAQRAKADFSTEYSSLDELLFQLQLVARDPMKEYNFLNLIATFFSDFRDSIILRQHSGIEDLASDKVGGKRKTPFTSVGLVAPPETFEFEDMSDTYWTDRVIQNGTEVQPSRRNRKREYQPAPIEPEKSPQGSRRPYKKRHSVGNHVMTAEKFTGSVNEPSPAELIMNFSEVDSVPSEKTLNNMFRRFGPLRESETEVDREGGRARVVFRKSSDAEIAYSSAGRFNIFGPRFVNYQLSYTPSTLFKASPIPRLQDQEMHLDLSSTQFQDIQLDLASFHDHEMHLDLSSIHDQEMQLDLSTIGYPEMESVLDHHHDQENKPNYTTQLGDMQADFSTIQYERQPDLASSHDHEFQTVFAPNQEMQSVPTASLDQELQHNFTSTHLGDIRAHHALSDHDELPVSVSSLEQETQPVFAKIKEEKMQPTLATLHEEETGLVLATIHEQETHALLATTQLGGIQADIAPINHEEQIVPATTLEHEIQPVVAMTQEERRPVIATVQEQEKEVSTTSQEHEMLPVAMTSERQPVLATIEEQEKEVSGTTQEYEMQPVVALIQEERQPVPATIQEQEKEGSATTQEQKEEVEQEKFVPDTIQEQEKEIPGTTQEQEKEVPGTTQEQDTEVPGTIQEQDKEVPATNQEHEMQPVAVIQEKREQVLATSQEHEKNAVIASPIHHEEKQPGATTKPEMQPVLASNEISPVLTSTQDRETQPLPTSQELEGEPIPAMTEEQEAHAVLSMEGHEETEHVLATTLQTTQSVTITTHDHQDIEPLVLTGEETREGTQPILASTQELETLPDIASTQEFEPDHDARQGQELKPDHLTTEEEAVSDSLTAEVQEVQSGHDTGHEQGALPDNSTNEVSEIHCGDDKNQEQDMQCDNNTNEEHDMQCDNNTNEEQDMQCDNATNENQDMQCDNATNEDQGVQSGNATPSEQDTQSDHEQEMQTDGAMNQDQETPSNFSTLHEQDMQTDLAEKHTIQDQATQADPVTFPEPETHPDFAASVTKDQETPLGLSSLEKNTV